MNRRHAWAVVAGLLVAIGSYAALPEYSAPLGIVRAISAGDVDYFDYWGGAEISYAIDGLEVVPPPEPPPGLAPTLTALERRARRANLIADVSAEADTVRVRLAGLDGEEAAWVSARTLTSGGVLELRRVVDDAGFIERLADAIAADPAAYAAGITMVPSMDGGYQAPYVAGPSRDSLAGYLASLAAADPALRAPAGTELLLERLTLPPEGQAADGEWRTHLVSTDVELSQADVAAAAVEWNSYTGRPEVRVTLTRDAGERFGRLTRASIGRQLAIVVDGVVYSAPRVEDEIWGGQVSISPGPAEPNAMYAESATLAAILTGEPLQVELRLVEVAYRPPSVSARHRAMAGAIFALLCGVIVFVLVTLAGGALAPLASRVEAGQGAERGGVPWSRLAVTAAALVALYLAPAVTLPTLDPALVDFLGKSGQSTSVFALGIMPLLCAFLLVEVAALAVPRWRALRTGGVAARARLARVTAGLAIGLGLAQGWLFAEFFSTLMIPWGMPAFADGLPLPVLVTAVTLAAGVMAYAVLAWLVERFGVGSGYGVVLLGALVLHLQGQWHALRTSDYDWPVLAWTIAIALVTILSTRWIVTRRERAADFHLGVRLPTAGIVPVAAATLIAPFVMLLSMAGWPASLRWLDLSEPRGAAPALLFVAAIVLLSVGLSWLMSRPRPLDPQLRVLGVGPARRAYLRAVALSTGYLLVLVALPAMAQRSTGWHFALPLLLALGTAAGMDVVAELRAWRRRGDLVAVWPMHRVQVVDLAVHALAGAGIGAHARGEHLRALLGFFGPFVPVTLMVPRARATEAEDILAALLGGAASRDDRDQGRGGME